MDYGSRAMGHYFPSIPTIIMGYFVQGKALSTAMALPFENAA